MQVTLPIPSLPVPTIEPEPSMADGDIIRSVAGIRPYRTGGCRIGHERIGRKHLIHNYGHGGAGVTMSWGSADEVLRICEAACPSVCSAGVIGAGVIGLTTALRLRGRGLKVRIYSETVTPGTTSDVAGAQWSPSLVEQGETPELQARFDRILRGSLVGFRSLCPQDYGVRTRLNYVEADHDASFYKIPEGLIPPPTPLERLPFVNATKVGRVFTTLLIEPPVLMPMLMQDCRNSGIEFTRQRFESVAELERLPQDLIVNCTGAGAAAMVGDGAMVPIRGQLILLRPQPLPWLLSHRTGYIFPRADAVVLGGTVERGETAAVTTAAGLSKILTANREFFGGLSGGS